jgi:hypothetical protein
LGFSAHAEEPILIYPSELTELMTILENLEKQNQTLLSELQLSKDNLQVVSTQLVEWETRFNALKTSWLEYESAVNLELARLDMVIHKKNILIGVLGGASLFLLGAIGVSLLP